MLLATLLVFLVLGGFLPALTGDIGSSLFEILGLALYSAFCVPGHPILHNGLALVVIPGMTLFYGVVSWWLGWILAGILDVTSALINAKREPNPAMQTDGAAMPRPDR